MIDRVRLSNGLTLLYRHTPLDPIAASHLFLKNGATTDPEDKPGLTTLHWSLFSKGTKKRAARKIAEDVEMLGASLGAGATYDYSEISCNAPADEIEETIKATTECLFEPAFDPNEIAKEKSALQAAIRSKKESIFSTTHEELNRHLYPDHFYGRPSSGTEKSIAAIEPGDLLQHHLKLLNPDGAVFSMASNIPFPKIRLFLEETFGPEAWHPSQQSLATKKPTTPPKESATFKCPTHFEQAYIMLGFAAPAVSSPDYLALKVINGILGGGMSTRLFQTLREKEGLAYDVGSFYATKNLGSSFVVHMGLQESKISEAKDGILRELKLLQDVKVSDKELQQTKNQLKGGFILDHQTNGQRSHYVGWWEMLGLGADFDKQYPEKIDAVTVDDVHRVAQLYFSQPSIYIESVPQPKSQKREPVAHVE